MPIAPDVPHDPDREFDASWVEAQKHVGLVRRVALQWLGHGLEIDDLVQEGLIGVKRAVELYDARRARPGVSKSFARYAARAAGTRMRDVISMTGHTVALSPWVRKAAIRSLRGNPHPCDSRPRTAACIAAALAVMRQDTFGTHTEIGRGSLAAATARALRPNAPTMVEILDMIDVLPELQRRVIRDYYGLDGTPLSQVEIGAALGITSQYVHILRKRGLARLREQIVS